MCFNYGTLVKPHLDYSMHATVSRQKFDYSFLDLHGLQVHSVQLKTLLCIHIPLNLLSVIAPISEVSSCAYSNHLQCSSLAQTHSFLEPKPLISSTKSVRPQHKTCSSLVINIFICYAIRILGGLAKTISSLAMNMFFCSAKSYSQVSYSDYLVTRDEPVRLFLGSWYRNRIKNNRKCGEIYLE